MRSLGILAGGSYKMTRLRYDKSVKKWEEIVQNGHSDLGCGFCAEIVEHMGDCEECPLCIDRVCHEEPNGHEDWLYWKFIAAMRDPIRPVLAKMYAQQMLDYIRGLEGRLFGEDK
jgi:hypothetical protein